MKRATAALVLALAFAPFVVMAVTGNPPTDRTGNPPTDRTGNPPAGIISLPNPLKCNDSYEGGSVACIRDSIIKAAQRIAFFLVTIMALWGGILILTAGGNPERWEQGKKTLLYAVIGYMVILLATSMVFIVQSLLNTAAAP